MEDQIQIERLQKIQELLAAPWINIHYLVDFSLNRFAQTLLKKFIDIVFDLIEENFNMAYDNEDILYYAMQDFFNNYNN